jgi:hypothetical protein
MPRKKNGWGKPNSFKFGSVAKNTKTGKKPGSAGTYPSDRQFGSVITRTAIEKYDIDSKWSDWRRGYELYSKADFADYTTTLTVAVFPNTVDKLITSFIVRRFPTKQSDTSVRYVAKRSVASQPTFGTIGTDIFTNSVVYKTEKGRQEIWTSIASYNSLIQKLLGERFTDNEVGATLKMVMGSDKKPAVFHGKSKSANNETVYKVPWAGLSGSNYVVQNAGNINSLEGQLIVVTNMPSFHTSGLTFTDGPYDITVDVSMSSSSKTIKIFDVSKLSNDEELFMPTTTPVIYTTNSGSVTVKDTYEVQKDPYQPYWGRQYFSASILQPRITQYSVDTPPVYIKSIVRSTNGLDAEITTVPYESQLTLHADASDGYFVWSDYSFTKKVAGVGEEKDKSYIDIDPWMDQTWVTGDTLKLEDSISCNCPKFTKGMMSSPESLYGALAEARKIRNRQIKYPLPSAGQNKDTEAMSFEMSGIINSWKTAHDNLDFQCCKHTIAGMFVDDIKVIEPSSYPSVETRIKFNEELEKQTKTAETEITSISTERAELRLTDFLYTIGQLIQQSDTQVASIMLGRRGPINADLI